MRLIFTSFPKWENSVCLHRGLFSFISTLPLLSMREGRGKGIHLQLAPNESPVSKPWKILLWMQTSVLNLLPEEQTLQFVSWGISCIPTESREVGNLATRLYCWKDFVAMGPLASHTHKCA